jgi:hypothetical protein
MAYLTGLDCVPILQEQFSPVGFKNSDVDHDGSLLFTCSRIEVATLAATFWRRHRNGGYF